MNILRISLVALGALGIAALFGLQIKALETIRTEGETVLLDLRPVDPRALMMGDFMALAYAIETQEEVREREDLPAKGQILLTIDKNGVGQFAGFSNGEEVQDGQVKINYIRQSRGITFGAPRYYFQNGTAEKFESADYGVFKISPSGRAILTALADEDFKIIQP